MTPSVALRRLWEQLDSYRRLTADGACVEVYRHFLGPIYPPTPGIALPVGDPVFDAIAEYASSVLARAGFLTTRNGMDERDRLERYGRLTRLMFATEHALAIDLARVGLDAPLRDREYAARATLAMAAFWCDRKDLIGIDLASAHPLLGARPIDAPGRALFDHAAAALEPPKTVVAGTTAMGKDSGREIGISITPAA